MSSNPTKAQVAQNCTLFTNSHVAASANKTVQRPRVDVVSSTSSITSSSSSSSSSSSANVSKFSEKQMEMVLQKARGSLTQLALQSESLGQMRVALRELAGELREKISRGRHLSKEQQVALEQAWRQTLADIHDFNGDVTEMKSVGAQLKNIVHVQLQTMKQELHQLNLRQLEHNKAMTETSDNMIKSSYKTLTGIITKHGNPGHSNDFQLNKFKGSRCLVSNISGECWQEPSHNTENHHHYNNNNNGDDEDDITFDTTYNMNDNSEDTVTRMNGSNKNHGDGNHSIDKGVYYRTKGKGGGGKNNANHSVNESRHYGNHDCVARLREQTDELESLSEAVVASIEAQALLSYDLHSVGQMLVLGDKAIVNGEAYDCVKSCPKTQQHVLQELYSSSLQRTTNETVMEKLCPIFPLLKNKSCAQLMKLMREQFDRAFSYTISCFSSTSIDSSSSSSLSSFSSACKQNGEKSNLLYPFQAVLRYFWFSNQDGKYNLIADAVDVDVHVKESDFSDIKNKSRFQSEEGKMSCKGQAQDIEVQDLALKIAPVD